MWLIVYNYKTISVSSIHYIMHPNFNLKLSKSKDNFIVSWTNLQQKIRMGRKAEILSLNDKVYKKTLYILLQNITGRGRTQHYCFEQSHSCFVFLASLRKAFCQNIGWFFCFFGGFSCMVFSILLCPPSSHLLIYLYTIASACTPQYQPKHWW